MNTILMLLFCAVMGHGSAREGLIAGFEFTPETDIPVQPIPVDVQHLNLNKFASQLAVFSVEGRSRNRLPSQFRATDNARLWFRPDEMLKAGNTYVYEIRLMETSETAEAITFQKDQTDLTLSIGGKDLLKYRHAMIEAPEGTDPLYRREGAYVHPLYTPSGEVLTNIQPADHYHHYGIWAPWTRTVFQGRHIDFWNLREGQGTVRHAAFLSTWSGPLLGGFQAHHEHVDFTAPGRDLTAINEIWEVNASRIMLDEREIWVVDYLFSLNCATDSLVELSQYRYGGGIGFRLTEAWNRNNSTVLTSEGHRRSSADATHARWCRLEGETGKGMQSGVVIMGHPSNWAFPEPMRVWPEDATGGTGELFFEFTPIRHEKWILHPGKVYALRYRMLVYDGALEKDTIDALWTQFADPPVLKAKKQH